MYIDLFDNVHVRNKFFLKLLNANILSKSIKYFEL